MTDLSQVVFTAQIVNTVLFIGAVFLFVVLFFVSLLVRAALEMAESFIMAVVAKCGRKCSGCHVAPRFDYWPMCEDCHKDWVDELDMKRKDDETHPK